jgi:prephenate dehydratase
MSRPIVGHPNKYVFFIGIEASTADSSMKKAIADARNHCKEIRVLGSYPVHPPFES